MVNCSIEFQCKDFLEDDMKYFEKKALKIANMVFNNPELIDILAEFLLEFIDKINFVKRYKEWEKNLGPLKLLYEKDILENFMEELYNAYLAVKDYHIDKFRGVVFENIMGLYYRNIYNNDSDKFSNGCKVIINGKEIVYICKENEGKNRNTVDIAGYNELDSRFYEVKVGPTGFKDNVIKYLNILNFESYNNRISKNIVVGCMTLKSKKALEIKLKAAKEDFSKLELNGINEVRRILNTRVC